MSPTAPVGFAARPRLAVSHQWRMSSLAIAFGVMAILALHWESVEAAVHTWYVSRTYNHGFIVAPISAYLIWRKRDELRLMVPQPWFIPVVVAIPVSLVWLAAEALSVLELEQFAVMTLIQLLVLAVVGVRVVMTILFPLLYLYFLVPSGEFLVPKLQEFTTAFILVGLELVGIPAFSDGVIISIPNGVFEVAEACAGLRFLIASIAYGCLFAYMVYQDIWRRLVFVALSLLVPLFANGLRALGIVVIAHATDNRIAADIDHLVYGWVFFSVVLLALTAVGLRFRQEDGAAMRPTRDAMPGRRAGAASALIAMLAVVAVSAAPRVYADALTAAAASAPVLRVVPPPAPPGWRVIEDSGPEWRPEFQGADSEFLRAYGRLEKSVYVYVAYYSWQRWRAKLISAQNRFSDEDNWRLAERGHATIQYNGRPLAVGVHRLIHAKRERTVHYVYWVDGRFTADPLTVKLLQAWAFLSGSSQRSAILAIAADNTPDGGSPTATVNEFLGGFSALSRVLHGGDGSDAL